MMGMILLHIGTESKSFEVRRLVLASVERLVSRRPELVNVIMASAVRLYLTKHLPSATKAVESATEDSESVVRPDSRLPAILLASVSFGEDVEKDVREKALVNDVVIAHHRIFCAFVRFSICHARLTLV